MVPPNNQTTQASHDPVARTVRFPRPLYKTLRKHCLIERDPGISINDFIVLAVKNQLTEEAVSLT
jgi:hypothetical protein